MQFTVLAVLISIVVSFYIIAIWLLFTRYLMRQLRNQPGLPIYVHLVGGDSLTIRKTE